MSIITVRNPFDLSTVGEVPLMSEAEAFAALERAHALHGDPAHRIPAHERLAILERLATLMRTHAEALVRDAVREGGKPWADSVVEVERAIDGVRWAARELAQLGGREVPMGLTPASAGRLAFTVREPRGVVLAISAFNHPVNLIVHQAVPAFAAGCPVLVKPASATPLSCRNVLRLMHEAGVPEAWATMLPCAAATAEKLVADPRVAFLSFIGSSRVGWHLRSKLAPGATCALEHGGAAPVVLDASADLDAALPLLLKGGFYHAGQVCVSVQRVFAPHETARTFAERLAAAAVQLPTGDPPQWGRSSTRERWRASMNGSRRHGQAEARCCAAVPPFRRRYTPPRWSMTRRRAVALPATKCSARWWRSSPHATATRPSPAPTTCPSSFRQRSSHAMWMWPSTPRGG